MSEPLDGTPKDLPATVLRLWREALGVHDAGPDDDFFELGGDSLVATRLVALLRMELGLAVPLLAVFDNPTAAELTLELEQAAAGAAR
ncbi:MAG TPA: phosphopantetheine-binding protein [Pseudonocardiaceae bacterium]|nr:phosphopantetheine-binding protein [Pseudonocardiaceae bacterium]